MVKGSLNRSDSLNFLYNLHPLFLDFCMGLNYNSTGKYCTFFDKG